MNSNREVEAKGKEKMKRATDSGASSAPLAICDGDQCSIHSQTEASSPDTSSTLDITNSMYSSAQSALIVALTQKMTQNYMKSHHYSEDAIYCATQLLRGAILWQLGSHPVRIFATPFLQHYFYQFLKDDRRYDGAETDPGAESAATWLATATVLIADIITSPSSWSEAILVCTVAAGTSLATKQTTTTSYDAVKEHGVRGAMYNLYHGIKNGIFAAAQHVHTPQETPRNRAWMSMDF